MAAGVAPSDEEGDVVGPGAPVDEDLVVAVVDGGVGGEPVGAIGGVGVAGGLDLAAPLEVGVGAGGGVVEELLDLAAGPAGVADLPACSGANTISDRPDENDPNAAIESANVANSPSGFPEAWLSTLWPDSAAMIVTVDWVGSNPTDVW